jgi:hypothetical protein
LESAASRGTYLFFDTNIRDVVQVRLSANLFVYRAISNAEPPIKQY